ncbi:MAG: glycosyl hydrolase [Polyangiales bacterium]
MSPVRSSLRVHRRPLLGCVLALSLAGCDDASTPAPVDDRFDAALFRDPPRNLGPHVRWWWPGGAVDDATIADEVATMARVGFGGIEQQTLTFDMNDADIAADPRIRTVGTSEELAHVATFLREAKRRSLGTSLTMGSGWPTGGTFSTDLRPYELVKARVDVGGPAAVSIPVPTPAAPEWTLPSPYITFPVVGSFVAPFDLVSVLAAPIVDAAANPPVLGTPVDVTSYVSGGNLVWNAPSGNHALVFVFRHRVDHLVAGDAFPNVPSPAHVVSHLDRTAIESWLSEQQSAWLAAVAPVAPDELFVDSFELVGELPWSADFAARFTAARGYPIAPYLPFVFRAAGESKYQALLADASLPSFATTDATGVRVREDYEDVRGELFLESVVDPLASFASTHGASLRLQAHGGYEHVLDGYARADIPESESLFGVGSMDFLELAASAAHVAGRKLVSSETFPVISFSGPTLTEDEMWMLAGRAYTAGIERLVYHGIAYPYTRSNGSRWYPFAKKDGTGAVGAGPIDITNDVQPGQPEWAFLPDFNRAMNRLAYAMTRGVDRAEIAWLLDEREIPDAAFIRFDELPPEQGESAASLALRKAGYRYDRISPTMLAGSNATAGALTVGQATYRALLITDWPSANPNELAAVQRALDAGVPVVVVGTMPTRARGFANAAARDAQVATTMAAITGRLRLATDEAGLATALADASVVPDIEVATTDCVTVSLTHRETANGHVFLVFHEHAADCQATLDVHVTGARASILDPITGSSRRQPRADRVDVSLRARRPVVLFVER